MPTTATRAQLIHDLPTTGFLRQNQIVGKRVVGDRVVHAPIPICPSRWWEWVKDGRAPQPIKLGPATTVWRAEEIHELIRKLGERQSPTTESRGAALTELRRVKRHRPMPDPR